MSALILNWRHNLLRSLFIVLLIGNFHYRASQLCAAFWIEQQRHNTISLQIVRHKATLPAWYTHMHYMMYRCRIMLKEVLVLHLMFYSLKIAGVVWFFLLQRVIILMVSKGITPSELILNWSGSVEQTPIKINFQVVIDQLQTPSTIASPILRNGSNMIEAEFKTEQINALIMDYTVRNTTMNLDVNIANKLPAAQKLGKGSGGISTKSDAFFNRAFEMEMKKFYRTLSEKDKRRYAGIEALKLKHGGRIYIAKLFGCSRKTVRKGIKELFELPVDCKYEKRIRQSGGGRKPYWMSHDWSLDQAFLDVVKDNTAGDPMRLGFLWTNLPHLYIAEQLLEQHQIPVSTTIVRQLLSDNGFRRRKALKKQTRKTVANRNAQFENITLYKNEYLLSGDPVLSMDTKKKEDMGLFRDGCLYTQGTIITPDHDFKSYATGSVIPHGIWDINRNAGYINLGISKDTSEFACDCIRNWWYNQGRYVYSHAKRLLILCDGGGSNSSRSYLFKQDIQWLADEIGLDIRIAHYPPYTSKYNPIEHRMFPHITKACKGVIFENYKQVLMLMERAKTKKGLTVKAEVIEKKYETGRKVNDDFKKNMEIIFDQHLPKWNYRAIPADKS